MQSSFDGGHKNNIGWGVDGKRSYLFHQPNHDENRFTQTINRGKSLFSIDWWYNITNSQTIRGRSGYEKFEDGSSIYCIAQFFPRMCKYYDTYGWQNKQFMGRGNLPSSLAIIMYP